MKIEVSACLVALLFLSACKSSEKPLNEQPSLDGRIAIVFKGESHGASLFPSQILLRAHDTEILFKPKDSAAVKSSAFVFPVWSPGGKWLLLPEGRFEGFAAYHNSILPEGFNDRSKARSIKLTGNNGIGLWHEFVRWKNVDAFEFRTGLSSSFRYYECNLRTGAITLLNKGHP